MAHSLSLLERQVDFLLRQTDHASFLVQLIPFLRALEQDPIIAAYMDDAVDEFVATIQLMEQADAELVPELVELRDTFVLMRPSADDSDVLAPIDRNPDNPLQLVEYQSTLAYFDVVATRDPQHLDANLAGRASTLINILRSEDTRYGYKLESATGTMTEIDRETGFDIPGTTTSPPGVEGAPPTEEADPDELDRWRASLSNIMQRHAHVRRWTQLRLRADAGLALVRLRAARDELNPTPNLLGPDHSIKAFEAQWRRVGSVGQLLFLTVEGDTLDPAFAVAVADEVKDLRADVDRLREDLHRRIGTTRSRAAVIKRFKLRCEWHDRMRMAAVAEDESPPRGPEDKLTAELARYVYDQGLNPLTKPLAGGLEPDLFDPSARFYVEAKQYRASSARAYIHKGFAQLIDTVNKFRGSPIYEVEEAFYVIFRRSGPYYELPSTIRVGDLDVHLLLIDLAPPEKTGRRQGHKPVEMSADEFLEARRLHVEASRADPTDPERGSGP
jgi:hypothetical protein